MSDERFEYAGDLTADSTPDTASDYRADITSDSTSDSMSDSTSDSVSDITSDTMPDSASDSMSNYTADRTDIYANPKTDSSVYENTSAYENTSVYESASVKADTGREKEAAAFGNGGYRYGNPLGSSADSTDAVNTGSSGYAGSAGYAGSSAGSGYAGGAGYSAGNAGTGSAGYAGSSSRAAGTGSAAGAGSSGSAGTRGASDSAGSGRYYSYNRAPEGGSSSTPPRKGGKRDKQKGRGRLAVVLAVVLVFILGAGVGTFVSGRSSTASLSEGSSSAGKIESSAKAEEADESGDDSGSSAINTGNNTISRVEDVTGAESLGDTTVADVAEKVMPAIVSVYNKYTEESEFFGRTYTQEGESAGSGIIIEETDSELLIVTNNHVVAGADSLSVQFIDETNCEAALKGTDASSDLAVISVSLDTLSEKTKDQIAIAELGDSDSLRIGEHAIAIGNALGYGQSLTVGYISALNREITSEDGITGTFIQTDAAINPGNSGGALLNSGGQVIGINSNKIGGDAIEGMGFAIPISKAIPIIDSLKNQESKMKVAEEDQGVLGIYGISVTSDVASAYGLQVGAYVEEIIAGGAAEQSNLQQGDIITAINGQTITGMEDLQNQLAYYSAGEEVTLTVQHPIEGGNYEEREVTVTLSKRSDIQSSTGNNQDQYGYEQQGQGQEQGWPSEEEDSGIFSFPFNF